ncbi:class I SAM-dependent methyltransferase [Pendulispora albinea]|uniref:Class I SAM-dependent methyltransferase n=1 Tax=Pendulispora albinea TaxID=2741071 RepID=A0ABZ2M8K7_9BACT
MTHDDGQAKSAADTFDALGERYEEAFRGLPAQHAALEWLRGRLAPGARVLDLGCGTGVPTASTLAGAGFHVTGIDVSPAMIAIARRQVPGATFQQADLREFESAERSWDAICAFFPLMQMSRNEIRASLRRITRWLRPGGSFVFATVPGNDENAPAIFMGQPVICSSYDTEEFLREITDAGMDVLFRATSSFTPNDPEAVPEHHLFVYAHRI